MPEQDERYTSYLLRCWQEDDPLPLQPAAWRFSLENVQTGARRGFGDFDALITFLQIQFGPAPPQRDASYDD